MATDTDGTPGALNIALYTLSDTCTPSTDEPGQYLRHQVEATGEPADITFADKGK